MKIYVQWATDPPTDWQCIDSKDWNKLPTKPEPPRDREPIWDKKRVVYFKGSPVLLDSPGCTYRVCIQGKIFMDDHICIRQGVDVVVVTSWCDDPGDYEYDEMHAEVWTFQKVPESGTESSHRLVDWYITPKKLEELLDRGYDVNKLLVRNFSSFVRPPEESIRHGIWVPEDLKERLDLYPAPKWEEWIGVAV